MLKPIYFEAPRPFRAAMRDAGLSDPRERCDMNVGAIIHLRTKAHGIAEHFNLTREERLEYAEHLLKVDCTSWTLLDEDQLRRLCAALEGARMMAELLQLRAV